VRTADVNHDMSFGYPELIVFLVPKRRQRCLTNKMGPLLNLFNLLLVDIEIGRHEFVGTWEVEFGEWVRGLRLDPRSASQG